MELLETIAISLEIEKLIAESDDFIIIVSPYLKINNRLKPKLADSFNRNNSNLIIYRDNELTESEYNWLSGFQNVILLPIKNLHAKCYISEKTAIIASMNLYDYSQINNHELGVKIQCDQDGEKFIDLLKIISLIIKTDHSSFDLSKYNVSLVQYTMGYLYSDLIKEYEFPNRPRVADGTYVMMCRIAVKHHKFDESDFKYDNSALKRDTSLDPKTYWHLKKELIKLGERKQRIDESNSLS